VPTLIPVRPLAKPRRARRSIEPVEMWALSLGLAAVTCASFVYFFAGDRMAAAFVLLAATGLVLAFHSVEPGRQD
jgi:hypothetical protein